MIYLHYKSLDQLNFDELFGTPSLTVLMPRITLRELDLQKNTHRSSHIQERARKMLQMIERWVEGKEIRPGVSLEFLPSMPTVDYAKLGLNPNWGDDILIATILQYQIDHPGESIVFVTQDSCPRMTGFHLGISIREMPAEHVLPFEPDPLELENRKLAKMVEKLQNALPRLTVCFAGSEEPEHHARFILPSPPASMKDEIARKVEELKAKLPKQHPLKAMLPTSKSPVSIMQSQLAVLSYIEPIPPEEYERYNRGVDAYLSKYEQYMRKTWELQSATRRCISFEIEIRNSGTAPAEDVDVLLHFPNGFRMFTGDDLPSIPDEPRPPSKPRTRMQMIADSISVIPSLNLLRPSLPEFKMTSSFRIERTGSYDVKDHFSRIKHGASAVLPKMFLIFDSYELATSFSCSYIVRPANLPEPISGELHFVIGKEDANKTAGNDKQQKPSEID